MGRVSQARERVLDSALALMQVRGYSNTSLSNILARAGVQRGSFYHFFPSKQALGVAVLDRYFAYPRDHLLRFFETDAPPLEQIEAFFRATRAHVEDSARAQGGVVCGCLFGNLALELSTMNEPLRRKVANLLSTFRDHFRRALARAVERRELVPGADVDLLSAQLVAFWEGSILVAKLHQDGGLYRDLIGGAMALLAPHRTVCEARGPGAVREGSDRDVAAERSSA